MCRETCSYTNHPLQHPPFFSEKIRSACRVLLPVCSPKQGADLTPPLHSALSMSATGSSAVPTPSDLRRGDDLYQTRRTLISPDGPKSAAAAADDADSLDEPCLHYPFQPMAPGVATKGNSFMACPRTEDNLVIERHAEARGHPAGRHRCAPVPRPLAHGPHGGAHERGAPRCGRI